MKIIIMKKTQAAIDNGIDKKSTFGLLLDDNGFYTILPLGRKTSGVYSKAFWTVYKEVEVN